MKKGIKARIYLTKEQIDFIHKQLGCCRFVYNHCLDYKKSLYEKNNISLSSSETINHIVELKSKYPFLKDVHSKVLQQSVRDLNQAYINFFNNKKGYPKFKSKHDTKQTCRFPKDAIICINGNRITIIKSLKDIHFKCSKRDEKYLNKKQDFINNITLIKTSSGKYHISINIDYQPIKKENNTGSVIGLDLGIKNFYVDSNGNHAENHHFYLRNEKKLKHLYRLLCKKEKDSNNRDKTRIKIAKIYEKITNQKYNQIQQLTTQLVNENQIICVEDLNVKGMLKNHNLSKHIQECNFSEFIRVLEYKCKLYGVQLVKVDRFYPSSKTCHKCGYINKNLKLNDRQWICPSCKNTIDRDYNSALNILDEGLRIIGSSSPEFKPVESPTVDDRIKSLKSSDSMKQEKNELHGDFL